MKKQVSIFLATLMVSGIGLSTASCGGGGNSNAIDKNKTQLYISNYDKGIGRDWVETLASRFAQDFANYSFEEGKTGVQVMYNHTTLSEGNTFYENLHTNTDAIFFTEGVPYAQYASSVFYDVTDIMNSGAITGVDENGNFTREERTIESKIDSDFLSFLDTDSKETEAYYAMPWYLGMKSINYNVDLWSENQFYFAKNGCPSEKVVKALLDGTNVDTAIASYKTEIAKNETSAWTFVDKDGKYTYNGTSYDVGLSAGPDGKYDTFDDGLPATYEEFYLLMTKMSGSAAGITPLIWTGGSGAYAENLTSSLWQNDAGVDELNVYYSLNGKVDELVKMENGEIVFDQNGNPVTEEWTFNGGKEDGYEIQRSISKYRALQFAETLASNPVWTDKSCWDSTSQTEAQVKYLTQGYTAKGNKIAMLIDGSWWQQEANMTFEVMEQADEKYAKSNRNFGLLPMPDSTIERHIERIENNEKNTIVATNDSYMFINGGLEEGSGKLEVAKAFLSYLQSDKSINTFCEITSMLRPVSSEMDDDAISKLSSYGKNLVAYSEGSNVVYPYTDNEFVNNNRQVFENSHEAWNWHAYSTKLGESYRPITTFYNNKSKGVDAEVYFTSMYNYYKNTAWLTVKK